MQPRSSSAGKTTFWRLTEVLQTAGVISLGMKNREAVVIPLVGITDTDER